MTAIKEQAKRERKTHPFGGPHFLVSLRKNLASRRHGAARYPGIPKKLGNEPRKTKMDVRRGAIKKGGDAHYKGNLKGKTSINDN